MTKYKLTQWRKGFWPALLMATGAAAVVNVLLWPLTVITVDPPRCFSYFHASVPCGHGLSTWGALAAAVVIGVTVYVVVRRVDRRALSHALTLLGAVLIVAYVVLTASQIV